MSLICYNPIKGCDDVISQQIPNTNPYMIANIRALMDEENPIQLVPEVGFTPLKDEFKGGKIIFAAGGTGKTSIADNINLIDSDIIWADLLGVLPANAGAAYELLSSDQKGIMADKYRQKMLDMAKEGKTIITANKKMIPYADVIIYHKTAEQKKRRTIDDTRTNQYDSSRFADIEQQEIEEAVKVHPEKKAFALGENEFAGNVLLEDPEFNTTVYNVKNNSLNQMLIDFMSNFGINFKFDESNIDGSFFNALDRIVELQNTDKIPEGVGKAIAFMMQRNGKVTRIISNWIAEEGTYTVDQLVDKDNNGTKLYGKLDKSEYFEKLGKVIEEQLKNSYASKKKGKVTQFIQDVLDIIKDFFDIMTPQQKETALLLKSFAINVSENVLANNPALITKLIKKPGSNTLAARLYFENEIDKPEYNYEKSIIQKLNNLGIVLTGSAAIATQGKVMRPIENPFHDLDFRTKALDRKELEETLGDTFENLEHFRHIGNAKKPEDIGLDVTESYVTLSKPFYVKQPNPKVNYFELYSKEDDSLIGKITEKSDLILENGITGKVLDFFVGREKDKYPTISIEAGGFTYKMANYKAAMEKKIGYGRVKDIFDYNRMVENDFIPSVLPGEKPIKRVSVEELKQEIIKFRQKMNARQNRKLANMITSPISSYKQLRENFKFDERRKRVKMIAVNFSLVVDDLLADYSELSRSQVIKGTVIDGQTVGGVANIFNEVYSRIEEQYNEAKLNGNQVKMDKIQKVFDNWGALMIFAQAEVSMVEDIKIGLDMSFIKQGNENSGEFNDAFKFVMEEAKREAWQDAHDTKSAYGSIPKEIRKVLSRIPQYDKNGEQVFDDLDFPVMLDRLEAHQMLLRTIGKRRNEAHMMKMLRDNVENLPWIEDVLYELEDPIIRTQFYTGLKRAFQFYSMITQKLKNGVYNTFAPILNKPKGQVSYSTYFADLKLGEPKTDKTIFKKQGNFNIVIPRAIQQLKAFIGTQINLESESVFKVHKFDNLKKNDKKVFIQHVFDSLNISYTDTMLNKLTSKRADTNKIKNLIADIAEFGLRLDSDEIKGNSILSYEMLLKRVDKSADNIDERGILESKISAILDILANYQDKIQFESRVRYDENSYSSDVLPSFMTDLIEDLKSFVDDNDIDRLRKYIADNYFTNSQFYSFQRKEILNQWLKELYYGDIESAATFINNISFDRNLGNERTKFSKFTRHDLLLQMFTKFHAPSMAASRKNVQYINKDDFQKMLDHDIANEFQDKENDPLQLDKAVTYMINGEDQKYKYTIRTRWKESERNDYAFYNMFVLGDSGISKFIKARRYGIDEIVEMMYTVYLQEGQRKGLAKIFNDDLIKAGYKPNKEQLTNASRFTFLPFLNEDYADGKYAQMVDRTVDQKGTVKAAIKAYLDDRAENLKTNFDKNKLLTLSKDKKSYSYLNQTVTINDDGTSNLNDVLKDYVYNSYFANIQQSQIFNIDPGFVKNSKAYQKRNKQVSASGDPLNIDAINPYTGEKYSETGIENTVYFQDINLDVENFDKNFAQTIAYQFGKEFLGKNAEGKTYEELVKVGRGTDKYQNYRSITLTDGQGYRTLDSYVSVMGMAGKWTKEMQNAYTTIKEITKNVKPNENLTPEQITQVTDQMLVLQPLKPFFYGFEKFKLSNGQIINIPVQNKYAEIILVPELLPAGSKLRDMAYWMQNHVGADGNPQPIDVIGSTEIAKVGNFGATDIDYKTNDKHEFVDVNGNVIKDGKKNPKFHELAVKLNDDSFSEQLGKAYVHQLPYKNYRIQTNVPEHINSSNLFGTQIRKLILKNINFKKSYDSYVGGNKVNLGDGKMVDLNGKNLIKFYNSLIVANIADSYEDFLEKAKDPETVKKVLSQMTVNSEMESNDHIIAFAEGLPFFEPSLEHSASSLFLSWFKKMVNKQSIKGGSAVQASAMGLSGYEEDGSLKYITNKNNTNILEVECEIPWDLNYTDVNGNNVVLDYNTYCKPDGNLILSDVVDTEGKFSTFLGEDGKTSYIPLIELDYPNITSLLAYRIPTENHYSMINLRVKRFSNKTTGGVIKVPPQGTVIAGFDFDIDKLFLMRYEFKDKKMTQKQIGQVWKDIYEENPDLKEKLKQARDNEALGIKQNNVEEFKGFWNRQQVASQSDKVFLFGDNTHDRTVTNYVPSSTQAVIRGLPNAIGIDTKKDRGTNEGKLFNQTDKELKKGSVVSYNGEKYLFWNQNESGKAQLIKIDGTKFSGTPNIDKLSILGSYKTVVYNNTEYIVTDNNNIYSGATGNLVYTGKDNSSITQKNKIIETAKEGLKSSYFTDADFPQFKQQVDEAIQKAKDSGKTIVIPADGIGTGKAMLKEKAPKLFEYLQEQLNTLKNQQITPQQKQQVLDQTTATKSKLYQYWEEAGLEGTPEEFFRNHLEQNKGKYTTFIQYDYTKSPAANDRMARNNMLIQLIQERLKDKDTFSERYTPGGFANPSIAAKKMRLLIFGNEELDNKNLKGDTYNFADIEDNSKSYEDPEPNYDIFDPMTMVEYTMQNNIAGDLIGIFANHNANYAISTLLDTFHLKESIIFGSFINAKSDYELGGDLLTKEVTLANGRVINSALSLAEFLSASVDAVKDPVLNFLNLNTVTADSAAMLARLGYSIEDIGLLLNQPVIKALCDIHLMSGRFDIQASIDELLDIYAKSKIYPPESVNSKKFTQDKLAANIVNSRLGNIDEKFRIEQLEILQMFANIQDKAQTVSEFVRNTKFTAANAVEGSFGGMYQQMDNINSFLINYQDTKNLPVVFKMGEANIPYKKYDITGNKNEYIMKVINNPFGYEQAMYDANRSMLDYVCSEYLPYNNNYYSSARAILTDLSSSVALSEDVINTIHRDVLVHYLNNLENSPFDPYSPITFMDGNKEVTKAKREYYEQDFPETLYNFLKSHPEVAEKELFRFLQFDATEKEDGKLDIKLSFRTVNIDENTEMIKESWGDLLNDENPQLKELGEMLYFYGFFTKGFDFGHNSIIHLVPSEFLINMEIYEGVKYTDALEDISEKNDIVSDEFIRQFIANHTDARTFITEPKGRYLSDWKTEMYKDGKLQNKVLINLDGPKNPFGKYNGVLKKFEIKPVVMVDGEYYMCMDKGFRTEEQLALYQRFTPSNLENTGVRYGTVNYAIDNEVTPESSMDDTQSIFGKQGTIEQQETPKIDYSKFTEEELIDLAYEYIDLNPDMDNILGKEMFKNISREDLIDTIQDMRQELVNKKIIDPESGNPLC